MSNNIPTEQETPTTRELVADAGIVQALSRAEIDQQIATARAYPRSIRKFIAESMDLATLNEQVAGECFYALPRDGKTIVGPSARLAEIVMSAWGNSRAGARIIDEGREFVTAEGAFHDLERNVAIRYEVRRRITNKKGQRFSADMIATTANAACSIAMRNAVFKGIPKALWSGIFDAAKKCAVGDVKTLVARRTEALAYIAKLGVHREQVFATLGVAGEEDIGLDELTTLRGLCTAIQEGDTTIEQAFAPKQDATAPKRGAEGLAEKLGSMPSAPAPQTEPEPPPPEDAVEPEPKPKPKPKGKPATAPRQEPQPDADERRKLASECAAMALALQLTPAGISEILDQCAIEEKPGGFLAMSADNLRIVSKALLDEIKLREEDHEAGRDKDQG